MLLDLRIKGVPLTFLIVLVLMVLLTIFFGAWAVSVDAETRTGSFAFGAAGTGPGAAPVGPEGTSKETTANGVPSDQEDGQDAADKWWGNALLKACPFH